MSDAVTILGATGALGFGLAVRLVQDGEFHASVRQRMAAQQHLLYADDAPIRALEEFLAGAAA